MENERELRQGVERLCQLTSELRNELETTLTADVFSLRVVNETEQIEKLKESLKAKAKSVRG